MIKIIVLTNINGKRFNILSYWDGLLVLTNYLFEDFMPIGAKNEGISKEC